MLSETLNLKHIKEIDPWFYNHYIWASRIIVDALKPHYIHDNNNILDIGCGDGIMALGVADGTNQSVTGIDLTNAYNQLEKLAKNILSTSSLPKNLKFMQVDENSHWNLGNNTFDAIYSWSVFEHVQNITDVLDEAYRVLKPNGVFFLQIEPLYYSPFGSHLQRLVEEPWAHLLNDENIFLEKASNATDKVNENEKDLLYKMNEFQDVKRYLLSEYKTLNKVTVKKLLEHIRSTGFFIENEQTNKITNCIPNGLLQNYTEYDLRTNEVRLLLRK